MDIYRHELMDHYRYPRNRKLLSSCSFNSGQYNPSCGDRIAMQGIIADNRVVELCFQGEGCVISQATASMLTEVCTDKDLNILLLWSSKDILNLVGIELGPTRLKCALLPLQAIQEGIVSFHIQNDTNA